MNASRPLIEVRDLRVGYGAAVVLHGITFDLRSGELVAIIGPNGAGKSTLLRAMSRLLRPSAGTVAFGGRDIWRISPRELARQVAFLPQAPEGPPDLTVEELAWRGRYPHRRLLESRSEGDESAVAAALAQADVTELRHRPLGSLSGGERQRAWLALALAQQPSVLLLDEPTTFLDIRHQLEVLALLRSLSEEGGLTVVMVMHDVAQAAAHARRLIALREGVVLYDGAPADVVTTERISALFDARLRVVHDPESGSPLVVPLAR